MDGQRFDDLAKALAEGRTRRDLLRAVGGGVLAGVLAMLRGRPAEAARCLARGQPCRPDLPCCSGKCCDGVCCLDVLLEPPLGPPFELPVPVIGPPPLQCLAPGAICAADEACCSGACCDGRCCPNAGAVCCGDVCCPSGSACALEGELVPGGGFQLKAVCCPSGVTCQGVCCPHPDDICCPIGSGCCSSGV